MADGQVVFEITADGKKALSSVKDITNSIDKESKKWESSAKTSTDNIGSSFTSMFARISAAAVAAKVGKALMDWGAAAVDAASDLQEVQNVVDTVFGEGAQKIEAWSKKAGQQFGLTETQAKKFTSTLGAMMKSSGLAGKEIVNMSTDLAGLAADMASFYNLDFETAFEKIRSGISGETMPLKQLGINMSVANLNAFALAQGLEKTFVQMSQGEQTMLRYQYLMQATADAQGDFEKTADGYANAQRRIQTALDTISTIAGTFLLETISPLVSGIADFLSQLTASPERTVFDDFNDIDLDASQKLADIDKTAKQAEILLGTLESIGGTRDAGGLTTFVDSFAESLTGLEAPVISAKNNDFAGTIDGIAQALADKYGGDPEKWKNLLNAVGDNAGAAIAAVKGDDGKTKSFLRSVAEGADDLTTDYSEYWENLLSALGDNAEKAINALSNGKETGAIMTAIASGANVLDSSSSGTWESLLGVLKKSGSLGGVFTNSSAADNVTKLATALSDASPDTDKAAAWKEFLDAIDTEKLSELTGKSVKDTEEWLSGIADAANKLEPDNAKGWNELFSAFVSGLPGLTEAEGSGDFFNAIISQYLAMGNQSEEAKNGLLSLGLTTDQIEDKQKVWLETCKRLVQTIPSLSSVINAETGEIEGGTEALQKNLDQWRANEEKKVAWSAYYAKERALAEKKGEKFLYEFDALSAKQAVKRQQEELDKIRKETGVGKDDYSVIVKLNATGGQGILTEQEKQWNDAVVKLGQLRKAAADAEAEYTRQTGDFAEAEQQLADGKQALIEKYGEESEAIYEAADAVSEYKGKSDEAWASSLKGADKAAEAIKAVADYYKNVRDATASAVNSTLKGFDSISKAGEEMRRKSNELAGEETKTLNKYTAVFSKWGNDNDSLRRMADSWDKLTDTEKEAYNALAKIRNEQKEVNEAMSQYKPEGMKANLESQISYMEEYLANLDKLKSYGISDALLASLSDGSKESAEYLSALAEGGPEAAKGVDELYQKVQAKKKEFTDALTEQKLTADETYDGLVAKAQETMNALDLGEEAKNAMGKTVLGIAQGITDNVSAVSEAVKSLMAELAPLEGLGFNFGYSDGSFILELDGSNEKGLDYVPFDGYLSELHEGEGILTAEENRIWQRFKNGNISHANVDYDALGGVMRDNVKAGGDVYLDGRTVGQVVSGIQGRSYRNLQRSGWQQ